jgi:YggT family protein
MVQLLSLPLQIKFVIQIISGSSVVFLKIYTILLTFRLYASWFPNINMYDQPFATIGTMTNFYIRFWRRTIPLQTIVDLSPIFGFWAIDAIIDLCEKLSKGVYLY